MKKLFIIFLILAFAVSVQAAGPISFGGSGSGDMLSTNNLSDVASVAAARTNIGAGTGNGDMLTTNNLSDLATKATARTNLGVAIGTDVQAYNANLTSYATATPSANALSLLGAANYAAMKTLLDLEIGTDVNAYSANIASYATATPSANTLSLLGAASYAAMRTLLGLDIGTNVQAYSSILNDIANVATSANKIFGMNNSGVIGAYGNIRQDNSAAQFVDVADATKLILIDPSGGVGTMTFKNNMTATGTVNVPSDFTSTDGIVGKVSSQTLTNKILTAPYIQGYEYVASTSQTLSATQAYGGRINNYGQATNVTVTLPTAHYGMDIVFCIGSATSATYTISATPSLFYYSGGTSATVYMSSLSVGNYFVIYSFKTGSSTWGWILKNGQGTIATS